MKTLANWNGEQMPLEEVRVPALDRGFMFGDSVYEVMRIYSGHLWNYEEHIGRLEAGLSQLKIQFDTTDIRARLESIIASANLKEALAYLQVTRGAAQRHHHYPHNAIANCLVYAEQFDDPYQTARVQGASAIAFPDIRWARNDLKVTALTANCMAAEAARCKGCLEAILVKDGTIMEGSHTSVFGVIDGKVIVSPSSANVLPGITKKQVIELCKSANIEMQEGRLKLSERDSFQELFITATPEEIIGIVSLDDKPIASGKPGPLTAKLQAGFKETVSNWLRSKS